MSNSKTNIIIAVLTSLILGLVVGIQIGEGNCDQDDYIALKCGQYEFPSDQTGEIVELASYEQALEERKIQREAVNQELTTIGSPLMLDSIRGGRFNRCAMDSLMRTLGDLEWINYRFGLEKDSTGNDQTTLFMEGGTYTNANGEDVPFILGTGALSFCPTVCDGLQPAAGR